MVKATVTKKGKAAAKKLLKFTLPAHKPQAQPIQVLVAEEEEESSDSSEELIHDSSTEDELASDEEEDGLLDDVSEEEDNNRKTMYLCRNHSRRKNLQVLRLRRKGSALWST